MLDIMYINKIPFIMTTSRAIHFRTPEKIKYEKMTTIVTSLRQIMLTTADVSIYDTYLAVGNSNP